MTFNTLCQLKPQERYYKLFTFIIFKLKIWIWKSQLCSSPNTYKSLFKCRQSWKGPVSWFYRSENRFCEMVWNSHIFISGTCSGYPAGGGEPAAKTVLPDPTPDDTVTELSDLLGEYLFNFCDVKYKLCFFKFPLVRNLPSYILVINRNLHT